MIIKNKSLFVGYLLAALMLLTLLNSAYFFLAVARFRIGGWLSFNACSLATIVYLICFASYRITRKSIYLAIALLPLYYYGTMGLFMMPWNAANIFTQITHIVITLNVIWILFVLLKDARLESLGKGLLIGIIIFVPVFAVIQHYLQMHLAEFMQILQKVQ